MWLIDLWYLNAETLRMWRWMDGGRRWGGYTMVLGERKAGTSLRGAKKLEGDFWSTSPSLILSFKYEPHFFFCSSFIQEYSFSYHDNTHAHTHTDGQTHMQEGEEEGEGWVWCLEEAAVWVRATAAGIRGMGGRRNQGVCGWCVYGPGEWTRYKVRVYLCVCEDTCEEDWCMMDTANKPACLLKCVFWCEFVHSDEANTCSFTQWPPWASGGICVTATCFFFLCCATLCPFFGVSSEPKDLTDVDTLLGKRLIRHLDLSDLSVFNHNWETNKMMSPWHSV